MKDSKVVIVKVTEVKFNGNEVVKTYEGTVEELIDNEFWYLLDIGHSHENEKGNRKVNVKPTTGKQLVKAVENAWHNVDAMAETKFIELV